ncbi:MAG: hypothetical protein JW915_18760 [Chitinispirillaceae bacterium]|nr:hypothetical protein [Chitinispirillaceae bacterium]
MNHKGITVIELLIYMSLFILISLFIGKQFKLLTNNYSAGKRIARQQTDMRDVLELMVREIRNTGLKASFTGGEITRVKDISKAEEVIIAAGTDSSSFIHKEQISGEFCDALTIKKIRLGTAGEYKCTDKIDYYVDGTTLRCALKTTEKKTDSTNYVMAEQVYGLQFHYGIIKKDSLIYKDDPINPNNWTVASGTGNKTATGTNEITLTFSGATTGALKCNTRRTVKGNCTYAVHLKMFAGSSFLKQIDSLRFAFKNNTTYYGAETFKPHSSDMWITVNTIAGGSADMLLEYDVNAAGFIKITGAEVYWSEDSAYTWMENPTAAADKKNVGAIKVFILMRSAGSGTTVSPTSINVGGLVFSPPTGHYVWRVHEEIIEVPNNGVF